MPPQVKFYFVGEKCHVDLSSMLLALPGPAG